MPEPTIRRANVDDAEVLSALGARTFSETFRHLYDPEDLNAFMADVYSVEKTGRDLADPRRALWLVEEGGEAGQFILVQIPGPSKRIDACLETNLTSDPCSDPVQIL